MSPIQYAESGAEHFIPYAKKKLRELHAYMTQTGVASFAKRIDVSDGTAIYLNSLLMGHGVFADRIRITTGVTYKYIIAAYLPVPDFVVTITMENVVSTLITGGVSETFDTVCRANGVELARVPGTRIETGGGPPPAAAPVRALTNWAGAVPESYPGTSEYPLYTRNPSYFWDGSAWQLTGGTWNSIWTTPFDSQIEAARIAHNLANNDFLAAQLESAELAEILRTTHPDTTLLDQVEDGEVVDVFYVSYSSDLTSGEFKILGRLKYNKTDDQFVRLETPEHNFKNPERDGRVVAYNRGELPVTSALQVYDQLFPDIESANIWLVWTMKPGEGESAAVGRPLTTYLPQQNSILDALKLYPLTTASAPALSATILLGAATPQPKGFAVPEPV